LIGSTPDDLQIRFFSHRDGSGAPEVGSAHTLCPHWHYLRDILMPQIEAAKAKTK
jgi:hypothetical protein